MGRYFFSDKNYEKNFLFVILRYRNISIILRYGNISKRFWLIGNIYNYIALLLYQPLCCVVVSSFEFLNCISGLAGQFNRLILLEDFNLPSLRVEPKVAKEFMPTMAAIGLPQVIQCPYDSKLSHLLIRSMFKEGSLSTRSYRWAPLHQLMSNLLFKEGCKSGG